MSGEVGITSNSCDGTSPRSTSYVSDGGTSFEVTCAADMPIGLAATDGSGVVTADIFFATVYSFESCMDLCAYYNKGLSGGAKVMTNGTRCFGVTYLSNLTQAVEDHFGNCFLKPHKGALTPADKTIASATATDE